MRKAVESRRWSMKSPPKKKRESVLLEGRRQMEKIERPKVERLGMEEKKGRKVSGQTAEQKCRAGLSGWGATAGEPGQARGVTGDWNREKGLTILGEIPDGGKRTATQEGFSGEEQKACAGAGVGDPPGAQGSLNGKGGGESAGGIAQDILRVGGEVPKSHGVGVGESSSGKATCGWGRGK